MKRLIIASLLLSFLSVQVYCQKKTIGVKAGPTVSGLLYSDFSPPAGHRLGFTAGVSLLKPISDRTTLGAELIYDQRGYGDQYTFTNLIGEPLHIVKYTYLLDYLALPCYVRFHKPNGFKWFLDLGMYPSYMISAKIKSPVYDAHGFGGAIEKYKIDPFPSFMRRFDVGALIGGGVQFSVNDKTTLDLNLRYTNGLISVFTKSFYGYYSLINSLNFTMGLNYKIK